MLGKYIDCTPRRCSFAARTWSAARRTSGLLVPAASCCASSSVMRRASVGASLGFRFSDDPKLLLYPPRRLAADTTLLPLTSGIVGDVTLNGTPVVADENKSGLDGVTGR